MTRVLAPEGRLWSVARSAMISEDFATDSSWTSRGRGSSLIADVMGSSSNLAQALASASNDFARTPRALRVAEAWAMASRSSRRVARRSAPRASCASRWTVSSRDSACPRQLEAPAFLRTPPSFDRTVAAASFICWIVASASASCSRPAPVPARAGATISPPATSRHTDPHRDACIVQSFPLREASPHNAARGLGLTGAALLCSPALVVRPILAHRSNRCAPRGWP